MAEFPRLKTGAVMQYPAKRMSSYSTRVFRFLDGSEQRYRERRQGAKTWIVRLDQLDEEELTAIEEFHQSEQGSLQDFAFTDPWDEVEYPSCRLENDEIAIYHVEENVGTVTLVVKENPS